VIFSSIFFVLVSLIIYSLWETGEKVQIDLNVDLKGKVALITGGNNGIGKAVAIAIAKMNARVIIACRSKERAQIAVQDIKKLSKNEQVDFIILDLSSLESVRKCADEFKKEIFHWTFSSIMQEFCSCIRVWYKGILSPKKVSRLNSYRIIWVTFY